MKTKAYLVNLILPKKGSRMRIEDYRNRLLKLGKNRHQVSGSLGGAKASGCIRISEGFVERLT